MHYPDEVLGELSEKFSQLRFKYIDLTIKLGSFVSTLKSERAREYINHGVMRRLFILYTCIGNIFSLFPPGREDKLDEEDRKNVEINLHAFLINVYGIVENLGLSIASENGIATDNKSEKRMKADMGLFKPSFQERLAAPLKDYLSGPEIGRWYHEYVVNYRDALAHRIPPYIPPSALDEQDQKAYKKLTDRLVTLSQKGHSEEYSKTIDEIENLGKANPLYLHSFTEKSKPLYLHAQIVTDFVTLEELITKVIGNFALSKPL